MIRPKFVEERRENAKKTLRSLRNRKEDRISMSKESLVLYCNETIKICEMLLMLMKERDENSQNR